MISGGDRQNHQQEKQRLLLKLSALTTQHNLLSQEMQETQHQLRLENRGLQMLYEEVKAERDDLQIEVWELEDIVEELFRLLTAMDGPQSVPEPIWVDEARLQFSERQTNDSVHETAVGCETVNLSNLKLALIGGHDSIRRAVIRELSEHYHLTRWVQLPPFTKHSLGRSNIKAKIHDCDLIVLITGYMKHMQTESVVQLRKLGSLSGDVLLLNCRGKSGVVREILAYVRRNNLCIDR